MKGTPGIDMSTGSLGQGISAACGMALSGKLQNKDYRVYTIVGDGESEEGQVCLLVLAFCIQVLLCCGRICLSLHLMVTLWLLGPGVSCSKAWGLDLASACWRADCGPELPGLVLVRE